MSNVRKVRCPNKDCRHVFSIDTDRLLSNVSPVLRVHQPLVPLAGDPQYLTVTCPLCGHLIKFKV